MTLRFSDDGPAFPSELMEALFSGDVVFLCGAGISAPHLPSFAGLVESCFAELGLDMEPAERASFDEERFEETLGTLSRRLADPDSLTDVVCRELQSPADVDLTHHRIILRLSRDLENRPVIVTTNFDTLIERALAENGARDRLRALSHAGQDLPQPGGSRFGGIIHLHGRIDDAEMNLQRTRLIVTSAEYGDAYMRSGWASRFLFDLARVKTLVLIGYRAGDAPVRYFLNVLEADRERFGDLKPVYAFDVLKAGEDKADPKWTAIAVEPLPYRTHVALWRDLERLAELVERPRSTSRGWVTTALRGDVADLTPMDRERVLWLFGANGNDALWDIPALTITDPAWFDVLHEGGVLKANRVWIMAAWFAQDFADRLRFDAAVKWYPRLGRPLRDEIRRRILLRRDLPTLWIMAWRLLVASDPMQGVEALDGTYLVTEALKGDVILHEDLERGVRLLTPVLEFSDRLFRSTRKDQPERVADLAALRLRVRDRNGVWELVEALRKVDRSEAVIELATGALRTVLEATRDAGLLDEEHDANNFDVPSVEQHDQNIHHDGVVFLVVLLSGLLSRIAERDAASARRHALAWRAMPGRIGKRLWLHSLRSEIFAADEAIAALVSLPLRDFWAASREVPLVVQERAGAASPNICVALQTRIIDEASTYYDAFERGSGDVDWRGFARDRAVRLRLEMLRRSGVLSEIGVATQADIEARNEHLRRPPQDRDFFGSYMSPVEYVVGDPSGIAAAAPDERIRAAKATIESPFFERQEGWDVYCRTDPDGALEALAAVPLTIDNASFWRDLITTVAFASDDETIRTKRATAAFLILGAADNDFLEAVVGPLVDLFFVHTRRTPDLDGWWQRLFRCAIIAELRGDEARPDRTENWALVPSARLAQAALIDIDYRRRAGENIRKRDLDRLVTIATTVEGAFPALAALTNDAAFLLSIDGQQASGRLSTALAAEDEDGRDLRFVLVINATMTPILAKTFRVQILRGVADFTGPRHGAYGVAQKILVPALATIEAANAEWSIGLDDATRALHQGVPALREAAVSFLTDQLISKDNRADYWATVVAPLLSRVWPRDRRHREKGLTVQLVRMMTHTGDAFPCAFKQMRPYLTTASGALHFLATSDVPRLWPGDTLALLWLLRGRSLDSGFYELPKLLEAILAADPSCEIDRRFQWLEQRAPRLS